MLLSILDMFANSFGVSQLRHKCGCSLISIPGLCFGHDDRDYHNNLVTDRRQTNNNGLTGTLNANPCVYLSLT